MTHRLMSLLVRNLRFDTTQDRVRKYFEQFGEVRDVYLPLDYRTKEPRGFGFVEFYDEKDANRCLDGLHRPKLDGNVISVTIAQEGRKSPETMKCREPKSPGDRHNKSSDSRYTRRDTRNRSMRSTSPAYDDDANHRRSSSYSRSRRYHDRYKMSRSRSSDNRGNYNEPIDRNRYSSSDSRRRRSCMGSNSPPVSRQPSSFNRRRDSRSYKDQFRRRYGNRSSEGDRFRHDDDVHNGHSSRHRRRSRELDRVDNKHRALEEPRTSRSASPYNVKDDIVDCDNYKNSSSDVETIPTTQDRIVSEDLSNASEQVHDTDYFEVQLPEN